MDKKDKSKTSGRVIRGMRATVRAKLLDKDGNVIKDLGIISEINGGVKNGRRLD